MLEDQIPSQCRLCLKSDDFPILIFDPSGTEGLLVWKVIIELLEFEISKTDGLPPTICRKCMRRLLEYKNFKKMCINSRIEFLKQQLNRGLVMPMEMEKGDNVDPLERDVAITSINNLHSSPEEEGISGDSEAGDGLTEDGLPCDAEEDELRLFLSSGSESDGALDEGDDDNRRCNLGGNQSVLEKTEEDGDNDIEEHPLASCGDKHLEGEPEEAEGGVEAEVPVNTEDDDDIDVEEHPLSSSAGETLEGESEKAEGGVEAEVPMEMEKGGNGDPLEIYIACTGDENLDSRSEEEEESRDSEVPVNTEDDDDIDVEEHPLSSSGDEHSEGDSEIAEEGVEAEYSNVSGTNSNGESTDIGEEEDSHETAEDNSLDAPRRTRRSARLRTAKGCVGSGNSEGKQGTTHEGEKNDILMPTGADGKNFGREIPVRIKTKKTKQKADKQTAKAEEDKTVSLSSSVAEEEVERKRRMIREYNRMRYKSMSEDKRREYLRKQREAMKRRRAGGSEEQKREIRRCNNERFRRRWSQMSEKEKKEKNRRKSECRKRRKAGMSEQEKKEYNRRKSECRKRHIAGMSAQEKKEYNRRNNECRKRWRAGMRNEERKE